MNNNFDLMEENEISAKSNGGTERIKRQLYNGEISRDLLEKFQIVFSRERKLKKDKHRIFYAHDLEGDPEAIKALGKGGWKKYHRIAFVSHWQQQRYIETFGIPWSKTVVMKNFIVPIPAVEKPQDKVKLIYHSTPHRGLHILANAFNELSRAYDNVELDVYSSFKLYGWEDPKEMQGLFDFLKSHPKINYHGSVSNEEIRKAIQEAHIFAYPSIWAETSCICLMEAMSGGLRCVHPNYGALYETAANWTDMYGWNEDEKAHTQQFYASLSMAVEQAHEDHSKVRNRMQKGYADIFYGWDLRKAEWEGLLYEIMQEPLEPQNPEEMFVYRT
jgi:UDP-glucose:(glucosyl)LPS alpha-1,2-glucosyltransferase